MCDTIVNTYRTYNINNNIDDNNLSNKRRVKANRKF